MNPAEHDVPLVTEDRALREAAETVLPGLVLWRWPELEDRIAAL